MQLTAQQRDLLLTLGLNEEHPDQSIFGPHKVALRNQPPDNYREKLSPRKRAVLALNEQIAIARLMNDVIEPARKYAEEQYQITIKVDPETDVWFLWPVKENE